MSMGTHSYGPTHLFSRFRGLSTVYYLGTCVASPRPEHHKSRIPIMNDLAGRNEPFQIVKDGENAVVYATMNRYDWPLLQSIRALDSANNVPPTLVGNVNVGQEAAYTRGTLSIGVTDFQLLIWWEYNGVAGASGTANDAAPVRCYSSVELIDYAEEQPTRVSEVACAFKCTSVYNIATRSFSDGTGLNQRGLYSESLDVMGVSVATLAALVAAATG